MWKKILAELKETADYVRKQGRGFGTAATRKETFNRRADSIETAARLIAAVEELRSEEGAHLIIGCDNPDFGGPDCVIEVMGSFTGFSLKTFQGENLLDCLEKAVADKLKGPAVIDKTHGHEVRTNPQE